MKTERKIAGNCYGKYGACALHAGYLRPQAHTQNMAHARCMLDT
jgi:hypothetical protein